MTLALLISLGFWIVYGKTTPVSVKDKGRDEIGDSERVTDHLSPTNIYELFIHLVT